MLSTGDSAKTKTNKTLTLMVLTFQKTEQMVNKTRGMLVEQVRIKKKKKLVRGCEGLGGGGGEEMLKNETWRTGHRISEEEHPRKRHQDHRHEAEHSKAF